MFDTYIEKLLIFIRSHDCDCYYTSGKLIVEDVYTQATERGRARVHHDWIEIEASPEAVREFLGY